MLKNNSFQGRNCNANSQPARKDFTRYPTIPQNYHYTSICTNCGQRWSHSHCQICSANGKSVTIVVLPGILQGNVESRKSCRHKHQNPKKRMLIRSIKLPKNEMMRNLSITKTSYQQCYDQFYDSNYDSNSDNYVAAISCDSANPLDPSKPKLKY